MSNPAWGLAEGDVRRMLRPSPCCDTLNATALLFYLASRRPTRLWGRRPEVGDGACRRIDDLLHISGVIAKNSNPRRVPIHPELKEALRSLRQGCDNSIEGLVIASERRRHDGGSIVNWFGGVYADLGMAGCSHIRATYVHHAICTGAVKNGGLASRYPRAGRHRDLSTTQRYIEEDRDAQRKLIRLI